MPQPSRYEKTDTPPETDPLLGGGIALLAFALPLVFLPISSDFYSIPKAFFLQMAVLLGILRVAGRVTGASVRIPFSSLSAPLVALLGACLLSLCGADFPWAGVEATWRLWNGVLLYHLAVLAFTRTSARQWFLRAVALSIVPMALYGIAQAMGLDFLHLAVRRVPVSTLGNTGFVAEYLVASLPVALALAARGDEERRWLFCLAVLLGSCHLLLTQSRAGWLAAALGGGILLLTPHSPLCTGEARGRLRRLALWGILLGIGMGCLVPSLGTVTVMRLRSLVDPSQTSARVRLLIWRGAWDLVLRHPLLGVGAGNFEYAYPEVRRVEEWRLSRRGVVDDAHNEYVHLVVEAGLVGLAAFSWFLTRAARAAKDLLRRPESRTDALPLVAGLAALLFYAGFGFPLKDPTSGGYWWMFLGYLSAMHRNQDEPLRRAVPLTLARAAAIVHAGLAVLLVFGFFLADLHIRRMQVHRRQGNDAEASAEYHAALRLYFPLDWTSRLQALVHDDRRMLPLLLPEYERRLRTSPNDPWLLADLGGLYGMLGRADEAKVVLYRALDLRPDLPTVHENLGSLLFMSGEIHKAIGELDAATRLDPSNARPRYKLAVALYRIGQKGEAEKQFQRARVLDPALPDFLQVAPGEGSS